MRLTKEDVAKVRAIYSERNCAYCKFLKPRITWWCNNEEAIRARGTAIPGVIHCPHWRPDKKYIIKQIRKYL